MEISIIIVNWNSTSYLRNCLTSLRRYTQHATYEVVVVDNATCDECCAASLRNECPDVIFHFSNENLGFARGCNLGCYLSSGETLLFLNPDTEIRDDVFSQMLAGLRSKEEIGAVGARLLNTDGSLQMSCVQTYPTILNQLLDSAFLRDKFPTSRLWGMQALFGEDQFARVDVISGACMMIKRDVFLRAGQFDDRYFMYVEDLDLCRRISAEGYSIRYMNDCEVIHHGGKSSAVHGQYFASMRQQEAMLQFFEVTKGHWYSLLYRCGVACAAALRLLVIVGLAPLPNATVVGGQRMLSLRKWTCIFRWAIGMEM